MTSWDDHPDVARLRAARPSRTADRIAAVCHPGWCVTVTLLIVSVPSCRSWWQGLLWATLAVVVCVALPLLWLRAQVRTGAVLDHQLVVREQRSGPLLVAAAFVVGGLTLLWLLGAPAAVVALVLAILAGLSAMSLVSCWHKASFHVGALAGMTSVLSQTFGRPALLALVPLLALCGWARVRAGRHTLLQVLVGLVVGSVATGVTFARAIGGLAG
ncbi:hypothetical protein [Arsenicicoccus dermatophilus]|uniref:hypothetical protein n=1 Tax=Arsenicicoccus dermatophilus TaxID=1076331 RepID=UPI001F4D2383|nr:hypothetical protein [Arsenicicoccus dermatophilus]MCH8611702.1 hypothetical protein [Arsenicicoccus dermatophilus]